MCRISMIHHLASISVVFLNFAFFTGLLIFFFELIPLIRRPEFCRKVLAMSTAWSTLFICLIMHILFVPFDKTSFLTRKYARYRSPWKLTSMIWRPPSYGWKALWATCHATACDRCSMRSRYDFFFFLQKSRPRWRKKNDFLSIVCVIIDLQRFRGSGRNRFRCEIWNLKEFQYAGNHPRTASPGRDSCETWRDSEPEFRGHRVAKVIN